MLRIAICDDDRIQLDLMLEYLADYAKQKPFKVEIGSFSCGTDLLRAVKEGERFDIYILDILMPDKNGIETAQELRQMGVKQRMLFLTSEASFVYKAFSVEASGYLLKPVDLGELYSLLDNLQQQLEKESPATVLVNTEDGERTIVVSDITFIDSADRAPRYHLMDGTEIVGRAKRVRFHELVEEFLTEYGFELSSVGVAVNLSNVESLRRETNLITMKNGDSILCSRTMSDDFRKKLHEHWGKK